MIFKNTIPSFYSQDFKNQNVTITCAFTSIFFVASLVGILNHELWLDEAHHWLLGRDSTSFSNLLHNTRYEGHPLFWNILLFYITRITSNPFWMQFLHIIVSTTTVIIFLKKAPFNWIFKGLFIFSYFMFFEYNIISRNYALGLLFITLACSMYNKRKEKFTLLCIYLAIAINTHLIFSVLAFGIYCTLIFESITIDAKNSKLLLSKGSIIIILAILFCLIQVIPPIDTYFFEKNEHLSFIERTRIGFTSFFKGLFTIPDFRTIHFWNSNIIVNINKTVAASLCLIVYIIPYLLFRKNKVSLFFSYTTLFGINIFYYITQLSSTRQFGITFIILIVALWIHYEWYKNNNEFKQYTLSKYIVYFILIVQFLSGIYTYGMDIKYPFASSKRVSEIINENNLAGIAVVTSFCEGTIFSPYLKKKVYFLCGDDYASFCNWNQHFNCDYTNDAILEKLSKLQINKTVLFISNESIFGNLNISEWHNVNKFYKAKPIASLGVSVLKKLSNYQIYLLEFKQ